MSKIKDTDYACPVARIRAVETRLLDKVKLSRMVDAESYDEAVKVIKESGYEGDTPADMLSNEITKTYDFLRSISPSKQEFDIFLVKNDYHNIKVILKSEFLGKNNDNLLKNCGRYKTEYLKNAVANRVFTAFSSILKDAVYDAVDAFDKTRDPQTTDLILDKAAYAEMLDLSENTKNDYIIDIVRTMIDLANIKIFVRVKKMKKNVDFLIKALIDGGKIKKTNFLNESTSLSDLLSATGYDKIAENAQGITDIEKALDNFLVEYIKKAKYYAFGIEPLIAYLIAKENEVKLARIILTGKKNGLSAEAIKERLRESYV